MMSSINRITLPAKWLCFAQILLFLHCLHCPARLRKHDTRSGVAFKTQAGGENTTEESEEREAFNVIFYEI